MMIFFPIIIASVMLALLISPFGVITSWLRLSWFGETLAHSALLGVGIGLMIHVSPLWSVFLVSLMLGYVVYFLMSNYSYQDMGQNFAILAHGSMALGIILSSIYGQNSLNIESWLFGEILALDYTMAAIFTACALVVWGVFLWKKKDIILLAIHKDMAFVDGVFVNHIRLAIMLSLAFVIALLVQFIGILLMSALLVIPCAIARFISRSPMGFIMATTGITTVCVVLGDILAILFNLPLGASIVTVAFVFWGIMMVIRHMI